MHGTEMLIHLLQEQEVDKNFDYPGGVVLPVYDALFGCEYIRPALDRQKIIMINCISI